MGGSKSAPRTVTMYEIFANKIDTSIYEGRRSPEQEDVELLKTCKAEDLKPPRGERPLLALAILTDGWFK